MFLMVVTVTIQLFARNFLRVSTPWTEDVSKYLLVWMTFLGSPVVLYRGEHLMVDLIYAKLNPRMRNVINILMNVVVMIFCWFILRLGIELCTNRIILKSTTAAAGIPRVYMFLALPVGAVLMLLVDVNSLVDNILILLGKKEDKTVVFIADETKTLEEMEMDKK